MTKEIKEVLKEMREYNDRLYEGDGNFLVRAFLQVFEQHLKLKDKLKNEKTKN